MNLEKRDVSTCRFAVFFLQKKIPTRQLRNAGAQRLPGGNNGQTGKKADAETDKGRGEITMLNVEHKNLGTVSLLNLEGQFVIGETETLRDVMQTLPASSSVILDLSHVTLMDAHGLGVMLQLREQAQASGMDFELMNVSEPLREILRVTRLDSVFHVTRGIECLPFVEKSRRARMAA